MKSKLLFILLFLAISTVKTQAQTKELWGVTLEGGSSNTGTIFKTDANGNNQSVVYSFVKYQGKNPRYTTLCEANNGKFYGVTEYGGVNDIGTIFEYDPNTNTYIHKFDFSSDSSGSYPIGSLVQANNGKLYGMTVSGGSHNLGVIFEFDFSNNTYTKKIDFDSANYGSLPHGSLTLATNGKLYGTTYQGGLNNQGVLFEYEPNTNACDKKFDFIDTVNGAGPIAGLLLTSNNKLYGTTTAGGENSRGVIFEYNYNNDSCIVKFNFDGANTGGSSFGNLIQISNDKIYGTTGYGGTNNKGVLFEFDITNNTYTKKIDFNGSSNGSYPYSSLTQATNGKLYGLTSQGGTNNKGVLFEYETTTNTYTKKIDFDGTIQGSLPYGSLIKATNGKLYGLTSYGGSTNGGVLFEYETVASAYTKKLDFDYSDGCYPYAGLTVGTNGKFYGTTSSGGTFDGGKLFEFDPITYSYTTRVNFGDSLNSGRHNKGGLTQAANGRIYGTTIDNNNNFQLFEYNPVNKIYTKKLDLTTASQGANQEGPMIEVNGKLYGLATTGGTINKGVIFEYNYTNNTYSKRVDFDGTNKGSNPKGGLLKASNGKLYGVTSTGGTNNKGVIFEYTITTNTFTKKIDFDSTTNGAMPVGNLIEATNGKLYGMTNEGGANNKGVLFEYDINTNTCTKKIDFDGTNNGENPLGSLMQASNGQIYGMATFGGSNNKGVVFEYNPSTGAYTKKTDFNGANGSTPYYSSLIDASKCTNSTTSTITQTQCNSYVAPDGKIYYASGQYTARILNKAGCDSTITINLTIKNGTSSTVADTACNSYIAPNGQTFTSSGEYIVHIQNAAGCDSIIAVNLVIKNINSDVTKSGDTLIANSSTATYQWLDCNNGYDTISGATAKEFKVLEKDGYYALMVSENGCVDTSDCYTIGIIGITENNLGDQIKIYPNPTNDFINLQLAEGLTDVQVIVRTIEGKMVRQYNNINNSNLAIELDDAKGIYFIEVIAQQEHAIIKAIKY